MKNLKYIGAFIVIFFTIQIVLTIINVPSKLVDETVSVEKVINNYETFIEDYNAFQQYKSQYCAAEDKMERTASRQMMYNIARRYNAMSDTFYKELVKKGNYPRRLNINLKCK